MLRKELAGNFNLFFYFFLSEAAFDLILSVFFFKGVNNTLLMDLFSLAGFLLITIAFLKYLKFKPSKYFFSAIIVLIGLLSCYSLFDFTQIEKFDLVQITLQSLTLIFITAIVLYNFSVSPEINMFHSVVFWFALGTFIYSLIDSVVTSATNFLFVSTEGPSMIYIWILSLGANITKMVCYFKGLNQVKHD